MARGQQQQQEHQIFEDVVAWVLCADPVHNAKAAIQERLSQQGARVAARLGREVTHIVCERRRSQRPKDKAADEAELLELFKKLEKLDCPPLVVSPLWVEESLAAARRLIERKFMVRRPMESLLGRSTPSSTGGSGSGGGQKRKRPPPLPKPAEAYELDDEMFSSTQQLGGTEGGDAAPAGANAGTGSHARGAGGGKRPARGGGGKGRGKGGSGGRGGGGGLAPVAEQRGVEGEEAALHRSGFGADTQAVANILTIDLPELGDTPGGPGSGEEEDELDTPLGVRFAQRRGSTGGSADRWRSEGGARQTGGSTGEREGGGSGGRAAGAGLRSRLAVASGPRQEAAAGPAAEAAGQEGDPMDVDDPGAAAAELGLEAEEEEAAAGGEGAAGGSAGAAAAAAAGVAQRFSVRQLHKHPEKPLPVHKGTPLPGALAPVEEARPKADIPLPEVERVPSPWTEAEQLPTQPSPLQAQQQGGAAAGAAAAAGGSGGMGPPAARGGRKSLLGVSCAGTPLSGLAPLGKRPGEVPTPWSSLRPWDAAAHQAQQQQQQAQQREQQPAAREEGAAAPADGLPNENAPRQQAAAATAGGGRRAGGDKAATAQRGVGAEGRGGAEEGEEDEGAPSSSGGCISLSSVDASLPELARSAVRRLRGMRLCREGKEEGQVTHLVVGGERRTLKLMLAVANGAWLLSPDWVTASLEAGRWLPESQHQAKVRFVGAAERARCQLEVPDAPPLLHAHSLYIHLPERARKLLGANATALRRVALALGAQVVAAPAACSLCVVVGGGSRPPLVPAEVPAVKEEWLLQAAERYEDLPLEQYLLP